MLYLFYLSLVYQMPWRNRRTKVLPGDFLHLLFKDSTDVQIFLRFWPISPEAILISPKNFLNVKSDTIKKWGIVNLSSNSSDSYSFVVLCDSEVVFLREGEDTPFNNSTLGFVYILHCKNVVKFSRLPYFRRY